MPAILNTVKNGLPALILSLLFTAYSHASANPSIESPDEMLQKASTKMLRLINENRSEIRESPDKLTSLVEKNILPHLDFITASKVVMGKYWRRAKKAQKIKFIRQFRLLLLRFYSATLAEYLIENKKVINEDLVRYFPTKIKKGETSLTVRAEIQSESGKAIPIRYRMHLTKKGWKIYDVSIEGISMITTYKNNFASQFKTQGIDALITSLEEKNKQMVASNNTSTHDKQN